MLETYVPRHRIGLRLWSSLSIQRAFKLRCYIQFNRNTRSVPHCVYPTVKSDLASNHQATTMYSEWWR